MVPSNVVRATDLRRLQIQTEVARERLMLEAERAGRLTASGRGLSFNALIGAIVAFLATTGIVFGGHKSASPSLVAIAPVVWPSRQFPNAPAHRL